MIISQLCFRAAWFGEFLGSKHGRTTAINHVPRSTLLRAGRCIADVQQPPSSPRLQSWLSDCAPDNASPTYSSRQAPRVCNHGYRCRITQTRALCTNAFDGMSDEELSTL